MKRREFLKSSAAATGAAAATATGAIALLPPTPLEAQPLVARAIRGTGALTITAIEPIVIRAPNEGASPEGPVSLGPVGATTGGKGLWNRLDHASPSRQPGFEQAVIVRITTNQGLIGWGECHAPAAPRMQ